MSGYLVSGPTRAKIENLLAKQMGVSGGGAPHNVASSVVLLKVQAGAANSNGYPARVQRWNGSAWIDLSATTVRLADPNGGTWPEWQFVSCVPHAIGSGDEMRFRPVESAPTTWFAMFTLPSALATTESYKELCTIDSYWGGGSPGATITVYNLPASTGYMFSGASGHKGLATYDHISLYWRIIQMEQH